MSLMQAELDKVETVKIQYEQEKEEYLTRVRKEINQYKKQINDYKVHIRRITQEAGRTTLRNKSIMKKFANMETGTGEYANATTQTDKNLITLTFIRNL